MLGDGEPHAIRPLAAVERIFAGHTFAPALNPLAMRSDQKNAPAVGSPRTRLGGIDERHMNLAECDGFNLHRNSNSIHHRDTESQRSSLETPEVLVFSV